MSNNCKTMNLKKFVKTFQRGKVFYDSRFDRRYGAWSDDKKREFILSLNHGHVFSTIVTADVKKCLESIRDTSPDDQMSIKYYTQTQKRGHDHVSLDGKHRTMTVLEFVEDKFTITGEFVDADDNIVNVDNQHFSKLPQRLRDKFLTDTWLTVKQSESASYEELPIIFKRLQAGEPLNDQEVRQADATPVAAWVRNMSEDFSDMLAKFTKKEHITRALSDEYLAKMTMEVVRRYNGEISNHYDLKKTSIDQWYEVGVGYYDMNDEGCPYIPSEFDRAESIFKMLSGVFCRQKIYKTPRLPKKLVWAALHVCEYIYDNNMYIYDKDVFFRTLKEIDDRLSTESELRYAHARTQAAGQGLDPDDISESGYYHKWTTLPHQRKYRRLRKEKLIGNVKNCHTSLSIRKCPNSMAAK